MKVRFGTDRFSNNDLLVQAQNIINGLTGNPAFPTPNPSVASLTTLRTALATAVAEAATADAAASAKTGLARNAREALVEALNLGASYVDNASGGDESIILSSGYDLRSAPGPQSPVTQVLNLAASEGDRPGEIDLQWDRVPKAASYEVSRSANVDDEASWAFVCSCTASRVSVNSMASGTRLWFRVRAVNGTGAGPWSDPAVKVVP